MTTPFYDDVFLSGSGTHPIPADYPDAARQITSERSMYDRPFRTPARLAPLAGNNFFWNAEACVVCQRPVPYIDDLVLGCVTYGFARTWNAASASYDPVQAIGPGCLASPSAHFVTTLRNDPTTNSYAFEDGTWHPPMLPPP